MTTAIAAQPFTVSTFLFGEDQDTEQALAQALHEHGVLGSMGTTLELVSEAGREAAGDQVAVALTGCSTSTWATCIAGWARRVSWPRPPSAPPPTRQLRGGRACHPRVSSATIPCRAAGQRCAPGHRDLRPGG